MPWLSLERVGQKDGYTSHHIHRSAYFKRFYLKSGKLWLGPSFLGQRPDKEGWDSNSPAWSWPSFITQNICQPLIKPQPCLQNLLRLFFSSFNWLSSSILTWTCFYLYISPCSLSSALLAPIFVSGLVIRYHGFPYGFSIYRGRHLLNALWMLLCARHVTRCYRHCSVSRRKKDDEQLHAQSLTVWLFATPWTVVCQALLSMGFSRQEKWSGLPLPSPGDIPNQGIESGSPAFQVDSLLFEAPGKPDEQLTFA